MGGGHKWVVDIGRLLNFSWVVNIGWYKEVVET